ncbi:MAG TPA: trypsin-like peptidase domain-containing protein [Dehalococcoidia bacterium]|jgi:S1-C subfamily serine protease|nr:trypsin-like peptidase domain-containing protein [Dehalococcoidia bacterium]
MTERREPAWLLRVSVVTLIPALLLLGAACSNDNKDKNSSSGPAAASNTAAPSTAGHPAQGGGNSGNQALLDLPSVVAEVKPATVQITNQQIQLDQLNQPQKVPAGVGSGVIYDDQGHILTNNHVIEGASGLQVSLPDGRSFPADIVGQDPRTDLAVIKIDGPDLPTASLGNTGDLQEGDWVMAIGNALGLPGGPTVTVGVVSALGRTVQEPAEDQSPGPFLFDLVQTDASINPGNSGGPLVNLDGQVIGLNTLVISQAEAGVPAQGIGFAISISSAKPIADQLVQNGSVQHAYLGVQYIPLSPAIAAQLGVNQQKGVVITGVVPGSPAQKAGLAQRDVVTQVDGQDLTGESDLARVVDQHKPGDKVTLTVISGGSEKKVDVTLEAAPA